MECSSFLREFHLKQAAQITHEIGTTSWDHWKVRIDSAIKDPYAGGRLAERSPSDPWRRMIAATEAGLVSFKTQIIKEIDTEKSRKKPAFLSSSQITEFNLFSTTTPSPDQLKLQDKLVTACEQGDAKEVLSLLEQGAKPNLINSAGKQPLGAAIWSMNPAVIDYLLTQMKEFKPMTWKECEEHNKKYYKESFMFNPFNPITFGDWDGLVKKMDQNEFLRTLHFNKWHAAGLRVSSWTHLKESVIHAPHRAAHLNISKWAEGIRCINGTEQEFAGCRTKIKTAIETVEKLWIAKNTPHTSSFSGLSLSEDSKNPYRLLPNPSALPTRLSQKQLQLQDELVTACEQGDAKAVLALLKKGAKPDTANSAGKLPLGAAVWGMNPEIVNYCLLKSTSKTSFQWKKIEEHNQKYYGEIWILSEFKLITYGDWGQLANKIKSSPFLQELHFKKAMEFWRKYDIPWQTKDLYLCIEGVCKHNDNSIVITSVNPPKYNGIHNSPGFKTMVSETETALSTFKTQIKQDIETASVQNESLSFG